MAYKIDKSKKGILKKGAGGNEPERTRFSKAIVDINKPLNILRAPDIPSRLDLSEVLTNEGLIQAKCGGGASASQDVCTCLAPEAVLNIQLNVVLWKEEYFLRK